MFEVENLESEDGTIIKIIGVGGAGTNAIENMLRQGLSGAECIVANTDVHALARSAVPRKLKLGETGLGTGANPTAGFAAAKESHKSIYNCLEGAHLLFIVAGMGGGTGTGAAPVIAAIAREMGILTIAVVTSPFDFEGMKRMQTAKSGIAELIRHSDSLIVIPNEKLMPFMGADADVDTCFKAIDDLLLHLMGGIANSITKQEFVACDLEDFRTVMGNMGLGSMGCGSATGDKRAQVAAARAIASHMFKEGDLSAARGIVVIISATKKTMKMKEVNTVMNTVKEGITEDAHIIFGTVYEPDLGETLRVVVVACGIDPSTSPNSPLPSDPMPPGGIGRRSTTLDTLREAGIDPLQIPNFLRKAS